MILNNARRLLTATSAALVLLGLTSCSATGVDAGFCEQFTDQWNAFANRPSATDLSTARDQLLGFWNDELQDSSPPDTVVDTLKLNILNLQTALSEHGLPQKTATESLDNGLGIIAQQCESSGHAVDYVPAENAIH